jgi:LPXTG-motif cell wall-anchored protein
LNGVYTFALSANDTPVTFSNIPLGTAFNVTELLAEDQRANGWSGPGSTSGTVTASTPMTLTFNNVYDAGVEGTFDVPDTGVLGDEDKLPQTGGISPSTLIGLLGLAFIAAGGTIFTIFKKKNPGKNS